MKLPLLSATALFIVLPLEATAQQRSPDDGWQVTLGAGVAVSPTYRGDDETQVSPLPFVRATYGDRLTISVPEGIKYAAVKTERLELGPVLGLDFGRDENGESRFGGEGTDDLQGLGDIDIAATIGGFVSYRIAGPLVATVDVKQALSGHEGLTADLGLRAAVPLRLGEQVIRIGAGPRIRYADQTYTNAFYGITSAQSVASGLAEFDAGGGIESYGLGLFANVPFENNWSLNLFGGFDQLTGDAADSPLIVERGDESQASLGLALTYTFGR